MALYTVPLDQMIAIPNRWFFTFPCSLIDSVPINTVLTVAVVVETCFAVGFLAGFAGLKPSERFMIDEFSLWTFKTCVLFNTKLASLNLACGCLWAGCMNLIPNTAVLDRVPRNICVTIYSPIRSPWVLDDPILLSVSHKQHCQIQRHIRRFTFKNFAILSLSWSIIQKINPTNINNRRFFQYNLLDSLLVVHRVVRHPVLLWNLEQYLWLADVLRLRIVRCVWVHHLHRNSALLDHQIHWGLQKSALALVVYVIATYQILFG